MGAPAKKDGKACEGYKIMMGGKVGENPALATDFAPVR
jgi:ferredoxin-nitrite reductase